MQVKSKHFKSNVILEHGSKSSEDALLQRKNIFSSIDG